MPDPSLRELIDQLHREIQRLSPDEVEAKARLYALIEDLETKIEHPDDEEHHDTVVESVQEAVRQFEVEHPRTSGILNHIMVVLGNMGI
jgi:hypothetical protein